MATQPKRVAVIGLDCALTHLIRKHIDEGHLPTFKKLFENGVVAENCLANYPTITPPGWASIATGATFGTHGISGFNVAEDPTDLAGKESGAFSSARIKAELIWDALDKTGKRCLVLNYPGSWPSKMKNGIMVGGSGLAVGDARDRASGFEIGASLCSEQLVSTDSYPFGIKGAFRPDDGFKNMPESEDEVLTMDFDLNFPNTRHKIKKTTWHIAVWDAEGNGYDHLALSPNKDYNDAFCVLEPGQWSDVIYHTFELEDGTRQEAFFRAKLLELADDAEEFRLVFSCMGASSGWSHPPEFAQKVRTKTGTTGFSSGILSYSFGWYGHDTYVELNDQYTEWLTDVARVMMNEGEWDLFYMHSHPPDWFYHAFMSDMEPELTVDKTVRKTAWDTHLRIYEAQDRMIAILMEMAGEDTLFVLISDHGATADGPTVNPFDALVPAGLAVLSDKHTNSVVAARAQEQQDGADKKRDLKTMHSRIYGKGLFKPDLSKCKAIPLRSYNIYVNLKGRNPTGIVEPADYEKVQQEIIDALRQFRLPETGQCPFSLVLTRLDARILGLYGENIGDVIYAFKPEYYAQHGPILPTAKWGVGDLHALCAFSGPSIKKGLSLERTVWLHDLVPTLCYAMNWSVPEHTEGAVLYQIFEDPNKAVNTIQELKDKVAALEKS